ncbi:hypothetical protein MP228_003972 [Amoeboaphelidium protococcarum]|nr:hypothetical protein MP228_003972 [Amoeboaphelidium protococcarum]
MKLIAQLLVSVLLHQLAMADGSADCKVEFNGAKYDLNGLAKNDQNYVIPLPKSSVNSKSQDQELLLNVCKQLYNVTELGGMKSAAAIRDKSNQKSISIGSVEKQQLAVVDGNLFLEYANGASCNNGDTSKTIVRFLCDQSINVGSPKYLFDDGCVYLLQWRTKYGCYGSNAPSSNDNGGKDNSSNVSRGMGFFSTLLFVFALAFSTYLMIGLYQRRSQGHRGWDQLPNAEFWKSLAANVKSAFTRRAAAGGYSSLGRSEAGRGGVALTDDHEEEI